MTNTKTDMSKTKDMMQKNMQPQKIAENAKRTMDKVVEKAGTKGGQAMMGTAAGVVVGAAVGGLAGAALTDEKTRAKLKDFSKSAADIADKLSQKASELSDRADEATTQLSHDVHNLKKETNK